MAGLVAHPEMPRIFAFHESRSFFARHAVWDVTSVKQDSSIR